MNPLITLTTDFGDHGPFVGVMKAVIRSHGPEIRIADLTHHVAPYWSAEAGFWLQRSYRYFPAGTVHVAVVDAGVGSARAIVAAEHDGHFFLAPDNGILPMVFGAASAGSFRVSEEWLQRQGWPQASASFHGRDIFAPLAAQLALRRCGPADVGPELEALVPGALPEPVLDRGEIRGHIVAVDTWGNLITNLERQLVERLSGPEVRIGAHRIPMRRTYSDVSRGTLLGLINSFEVLEIACAGGNAAEALGLRHGDAVTVVAAD